ncbi:hypothetical protein EOM86_06010, partial [Candidatus Nomurabacteria bacterium]|nr:hypothetical protein [Candidatus Nomurabacteria bacterium]
MATTYDFNGKQIKLAGIYSAIKSGIKNPPLNLSYGKVLIVDTGSAAGAGFGAGIDGELRSGADAIYSGIVDMEMMKAAMKSGIWWKLAEHLFSPDGDERGVSEIIFARAATTVAAKVSYTFTNASVEIKVRDEGTVGNGVVADSKVRSGYAAVFSAGIIDPSKYKMAFYLGSYRGDDGFNNDIPYDGVTDTSCEPQLLLESPEVANHAELKAWMEADKSFNTFFKLATYTITTTGLFTGTGVGEDLTVHGGVHKAAAGGTETYSAANLSLVLDYVRNMDFSLILCDNYGEGAGATDGADGTHNQRIHYHILKEARFEKIMIIGGGSESDE